MLVRLKISVILTMFLNPSPPGGQFSLADTNVPPVSGKHSGQMAPPIVSYLDHRLANFKKAAKNKPELENTAAFLELQGIVDALAKNNGLLFPCTTDVAHGSLPSGLLYWQDPVVVPDAVLQWVAHNFPV